MTVLSKSVLQQGVVKGLQCILLTKIKKTLHLSSKVNIIITVNILKF